MKNILVIGLIIICSILSVTGCMSRRDNENIDIIKVFLYRVKKSDLNSRQIIDTFMMENPSADYLKTQESFIPALQEELQRVNIETLKIVPYNRVNKKYQTIINEDIDLKDVYGVLKKDSVYHFILMDKKRIKSFSTMKFGDDTAKRIFMF